jgi:ResB-like family protein
VNTTLRSVLRAWSSLRLTVVLLAMSIFLIFAGTWAQIDLGIWSVLHTYFRTFFVWIPFQIFLPRRWDVPGGFPYPGGWLLGGMLAVNLLAAHAVRFKLSWRRSGILLIHSGLILLLVGELVTGMFAVESRLTIDEGQTVNYAEDTREVELAIIDPSDPQHDQVVVIPEGRLHRKRRIEDPRLPFALDVEAYLRNADLAEAEQAAAALPGLPQATRGFAAQMGLHAVPRQPVSGVDQDQIDLPVAFVSPVAAGQSLGTYIAALYFSLAPRFGPQAVEANGKTYLMELRYKRLYKPYSIRLIDFQHDRYLGTDTPRNFSSRIRLVDPSRNENREVLIYMNNPLRYRGETFYQASFKQGDTGTVLEVVRNPGWLLPYLACTLGAIGMLFHFGLHLGRFMRRNRALEPARNRAG